MKDQVKNALEKIIKDLLPIPAALQAQVLSVESDNATCKVKLINSELELESVRLRAVNDQKNTGLVVYPTEGSKVLIGFVNANISEAYILKESAVDLIQIITKEMKVQADQFTFNSDDFGGLIKINELKKQIDKNSAILDVFLSTMRDSVITEPGNGAASSLQLALKIALTGKSVADLSKIENTKIKHG